MVQWYQDLEKELTFLADLELLFQALLEKPLGAGGYMSIKHFIAMCIFSLRQYRPTGISHQLPNSIQSDPKNDCTTYAEHAAGLVIVHYSKAG